jgi:hypothetical protein
MVMKTSGVDRRKSPDQQAEGVLSSIEADRLWKL